MTNKLFPTHFNVILDEGERGALEQLWHYNPGFDEEVDLFHAVLREGIAVMTRDTKAQAAPADALRRGGEKAIHCGSGLDEGHPSRVGEDPHRTPTR